MSQFNDASSLWDLSLTPSLPALADDEFIALLQKQFGVGNDVLAKEFASEPVGNVNPRALTRFPVQAVTPPSDDSSPSPSGGNQEAPQTRSRRQSGLYDDDDDDHEDPALKRKASDEDLDDEPNHKSQHTSSSKRNSTSRRKSTGNNADESRLLKRKEQNRAAQRAFRERKEKHVKDLEDKVAALEEKNATAVSENETLREVISRLQNENVKLRQSSFTFSVPQSSGTDSPAAKETVSSSTRSPSDDSAMNLFNSPPSAASSTSASTHDSPQSLFLNEKNDQIQSPLSFFGQPGLQVIEPDTQQTATGESMGMDFGFGPLLNGTPYTTIASNPMFMSFREPDPYNQYNNQSPPNLNGGAQAFDFSNGFASWPDVNMQDNMQAFDLTGSLDELFGGAYIGQTGPLDFAGFPKGTSPATSLSPVSHQSVKSPQSGGVASGSSPSGSSPSSQSQSQSPAGMDILGTCGDGNTGGKCTKEKLANAIANDTGSMFAQKTPLTPAEQSNLADIIPCKNLQLPKVAKSDQNMEVMAAWRKIRANPQYQDLDINDLCGEFASKARCDGSQVVVEPTGLKQIMDSIQKKKGLPV